MNNKQISLVIFIVVGLFITFIGVGISYEKYGVEISLGEIEIVKTNCYDRYNNVIIELKCEKETIKDYDDEIIMPLILGAIMMSVGLIGLMLLEDLQ